MVRQAAVAEQLERILASPQFREAPRLQNLLRFIVSLTVEGKQDQLKEATIASEVFGRVGTNGDSLVRSAVTRLRARLEQYYGQEGAQDPVIIVIPKGGYAADIRDQKSVTEEPAPPEESHSRRGGAPGWILAAATIVVMAVFLAALVSRKQAVARASNSEAQELYLNGRYYWTRRTPEDLNRAVDYFTQAVVKDPGYTQAYVGLADTYNLLSEYTTMPYDQAFKRAIAAARTAVSLDDRLAGAHNSLAFALFYGAWDAKTAEREFRRALELNTGYSTAHHWYATFLMSLGRYRESLEQITLAQEFEPSSKSILADKGMILLWAGQRAAACNLLEEIEASEPEFSSPHRYLATAYLLEKRYPDYLAESQKAASTSGDQAALAITAAGAKGLEAAGPAGMLEAMQGAARSLPNGEPTRYYQLAQISAISGKTDAAMRYLELAYRQRDTRMVTIAADPDFAAMRETPKFERLVSEVGVVTASNP